MPLCRSAAVVAAIATTIAAGAQESKRVVLKDSTGAAVGSVMEVENGNNNLAYVSLETPFGLARVGFFQSQPRVSGFTAYFTTTDCSGLPLVMPSAGIWQDAYVLEDGPDKLLAVPDPTTTQTRDIVRKMNFPAGLPTCQVENIPGMQTAMLGAVLNLTQTYPPPYYVENAVEATFHALTPCRLLDTRTAGGQTTGQPLTNPGPHPFRVQGNCGVPGGAKSVAVNLTVTGGTKNGDVRLYPFTQTPTVNDPSSINFAAGQTIANAQLLTLSPVAAAGDKDMKLIIGMAGAAASGSVHVIVDVTGYFE